MLRKRIIKKLSIATAGIFVLLLLCLLPSSKLDLNINDIEIVNNDIKTTNVYLLDNNDRLVRTKVVLSSTTIEDNIKEIIEILIKDGVGESIIPSGCRSIIPSSTNINNIDINDKIVSIDFSNNLFDVSENMEDKVVESLVYSLTELDNIDGIKILIDSKEIDKLPKSKKNIPNIITRDYGINKVFDISYLDNINHITTYFIDKINDNYYYIPVTKYVNDNREKIEIIIEELSSSKTYTSDLLSFLNSNTKLLEVQLSEDIMNLTFNSYILSDFDKKNILEEVIYTICLSIKDNYNVKEVVFNIENEEIYKSVLKTIE